MSNLLVHISSDTILLHDGSDVCRIPYIDLERRMPEQCLSFMNDKQIKQIYVVNWPWSFTILRIGTLCVNMIQDLSESQITVLSCSKFDIYASLIQQEVLPPLWCVFSGQRKKMWLSEFDMETATRNKQYVTDATVHTQLWERTYRIDRVENHHLVGHLDTSKMCTDFAICDRWVTVEYAWNNHLVPLPVFKKQDTPLVPQYMMDPVLN